METCTECSTPCDTHYWLGNDVVCRDCFITSISIDVEPVAEERITETPEGISIFYPTDRFQPTFNLETHAKEWPVLTDL